MIKLWNRILRSLPIVVLTGGLLPALAQAQFTQQGAKLVGTGAVNPTQQGFSVSLSSDGNTAIAGGFEDDSSIGAAWVYAKPAFAGTPGKANCFGQSVTALQVQFGGLNAAAAALGFPTVPALQNAIMAFCGG